jgi:hypothetical protein
MKNNNVLRRVTTCSWGQFTVCVGYSWTLVVRNKLNSSACGPHGGLVLASSSTELLEVEGRYARAAVTYADQRAVLQAGPQSIPCHRQGTWSVLDQLRRVTSKRVQ